MTSILRYSVPSLTGIRGAGFGNEVIAWGKAFIGAQELDLRPLHPAWALNPRGYRRDFGTSPLDWPAHQALHALPSLHVSTELANSHDDYADVMRSLREQVPGRGPLAVFHDSGMAGGYYGIRRARGFLRSAVLSPAHVQKDLYSIEQRLASDKLRVALHIRAGDFSQTLAGPHPGEFNMALPIGWYASIAERISTAFPDKVDFLIFTDDDSNPAIAALAAHLDAKSLPQRRRPLLSDIGAMASSDLLVCSVSSLSMFAAFISEKPYVWFGPHLGENAGFKSIWGHEPGQAEGLTHRNASAWADPITARGTAVEPEQPLPDGLLGTLERALALKDPRTDLLLYGVTR